MRVANPVVAEPVTPLSVRIRTKHSLTWQTGTFSLAKKLMVPMEQSSVSRVAEVLIRREAARLGVTDGNFDAASV